MKKLIRTEEVTPLAEWKRVWNSRFDDSKTTLKAYSKYWDWLLEQNVDTQADPDFSIA